MTANRNDSPNKAKSDEPDRRDSGIWHQTPPDTTKKADAPGFELDEDRSHGQNSATALQEGQIPGEQPTKEPTHIGRTQSTTNSQ